ncbi:MAG: PepSY domain-containing protein [Dokdonella sp.]|uniref:PepSY domain-containing protein n=1 Tax=Dokdonella sp. TaxID=2291710 RepID=UPI0025B9F214|nr:PepSY domain-containing protein [Dokdonella sp.]MBX3699693.1 PepSY domain-containing protein [Dokdonella sp.]MCW5577197.1 PepSY domain-containing protein [Dokdonella sp.]
MHVNLLPLGIAFALAAATPTAHASTYDGDCTDKPKSEWLSTTEVKVRFEAQGYVVGKVKSSGTCYEVYARDKDGAKVELFVSPADAHVVSQAGAK